ncbi:hypothetical protein DPMN_134435 [Dreissena polymorpha]|uniref:Uncharacterized protein n=1 Tax=Dreissena polymorpha TaxID=45954 RepID=A0A9D4JBW5_DREPO|nr:hypothetical protein DPMN_134435 [Dreissena polymorpha]
MICMGRIVATTATECSARTSYNRLGCFKRTSTNPIPEASVCRMKDYVMGRDS